MMIQPALIALLGVGLVHLAGTGAKGAAPKERVILDTDIGDDIDDAFALALLCVDRNVDLLGVTTAFGPTKDRAKLAAKLLAKCGRSEVPVFAGRSGPQKIGDQYLWAKDYASVQIKSQPAAAFIDGQLRRYPGEVVIVAIGPLTNLADLLSEYPQAGKRIKRVVLMGGALHVGYNDRPPPMAEYNIYSDIKSAKAVFSSGIPLTMAGLDVTSMMQLDAARQKRLWAAGASITDALSALTRLWSGPVPTLHDPLTVAYATGHVFCGTEDARVEVDDDGLTRIVPGAANVTVLTNARPADFLDWIVSRLSGDE